VSDVNDPNRMTWPSAPDPSTLTTQQLMRSIQAERDYVNGQVAVLMERLTGIDKATELRLQGITDIPIQIAEKVDHLAALMNERFNSVEKQFDERDTRSERESKDNKVAVDAAFAAQKEAASEQNKSNTLAIDKSERATAETLNKQADLFKSTTDALADKIDDLKDNTARQLADLKESRAANTGGTAGSKATIAYIIAAIGAVSGLIGIIGAIIAMTG
jgi:hypothetical protein